MNLVSKTCTQPIENDNDWATIDGKNSIYSIASGGNGEKFTNIKYTIV